MGMCPILQPRSLSKRKPPRPAVCFDGLNLDLGDEGGLEVKPLYFCKGRIDFIWDLVDVELWRIRTQGVEAYV